MSTIAGLSKTIAGVTIGVGTLLTCVSLVTRALGYDARPDGAGRA